jgi:hypothetical protein
MYSRKQLTLLALLGVTAVINGRQMRNGQIKSQMKQDSYRTYEPTRQIWSEEVSEPVHQEEHSARVPSTWTHQEEEHGAAPQCQTVAYETASEPVRHEDNFVSFYNPPSIPLFTYNEETARYESSPQLLTGVNYYYYDQPTRSYEAY